MSTKLKLTAIILAYHFAQLQISCYYNCLTKMTQYYKPINFNLEM